MFARILDEAGVVLLFRDKVYLHPDKVKIIALLFCFVLFFFCGGSGTFALKFDMSTCFLWRIDLFPTENLNFCFSFDTSSGIISGQFGN